jgi:transcriptional regulator with XRE-family HTH domain
MLKEVIEEKYGSINKFVDQSYLSVGLSRTRLYNLIKLDSINPTIRTIIKLSEVTGIPEEELFNEYVRRYRNSRATSQH